MTAHLDIHKQEGDPVGRDDKTKVFNHSSHGGE